MRRLFCLGLILWLLLGSVAAQEQPSYEYALLLTKWSDSFEIHTVTFDTHRVQPKMTFALPKDYRVQYAASLSPDGQWLAVMLVPVYPSPDTKTMMRVIHIATRDTYDRVIYGFSPPILTEINDRFVWSPNSRYLAMNVINARNVDSIQIFSTQSRQWLTAGSQERGHHRITWSPDSLQFVTGTYFGCQSLDGCRTNVQIYEIGTTEPTLSITVPQEQYRAISLCHFTWSPNRRYIAFRSGCGGAFESSASAVKELYLLDIHDRTIKRITDYTYRQRSDPFDTGLHIEGLFESYWFDDNTLISGTFYGRISAIDMPPKVQSATILYHPSTQQTTTLTTKRLTRWAANPVTDQVAYQSDMGLTSLDYTPITPTVEIGTFDGESIATQFTLPDGCDPVWSPDGRYLAYSQYEIPECRFFSLDVKHLFLADGATGDNWNIDLQYLPRDRENGYLGVYGLGWIAEE